MSFPVRHPHAVWRAVHTCLRFLLRVLKFLCILALIALPAPLTTLLSAIIVRGERRNLPAEVLRKR